MCETIVEQKTVFETQAVEQLGPTIGPRDYE